MNDNLFFITTCQVEGGFDFLLTFYAVVAYLLIGLGLTGLILLTRQKLIGSAECSIFINENDDLTKKVQAGDTLLGALTGNGVPIPSPCGGKATCKQCRIQVTEGGGAVLEVDRSSFSRRELKDGWRLACQCKVKEDIHVHVDEGMLDVQELDGVVVSNRNVATFIKELVVEIPEAVEYRPGDYLQFHVPAYKTNTTDWKETIEEEYWADWETFSMFDREIDFSSLDGSDIRAYSMASHPAEKNKLIFNIRIATSPFDGKEPSRKIPWGLCSSYTFSLKPGDKVKLSGPYGESHMIDNGSELVFLIGGAGSSFGRSHIMDLFRTRNTDRKVSLWYGARSIKENIYQKEYEKLAEDFENFSYHLALSEPLPEDIEAGWDTKDPTKTNFLFKAFEEGQLKHMDYPEDCLYYVCGPPLHNSSVMTLLDSYGVPRNNIVLDDFGS